MNKQNEELYIHILDLESKNNFQKLINIKKFDFIFNGAIISNSLNTLHLNPSYNLLHFSIITCVIKLLNRSFSFLQYNFAEILSFGEDWFFICVIILSVGCRTMFKAYHFPFRVLRTGIRLLITFLIIFGWRRSFIVRLTGWSFKYL